MKRRKIKGLKPGSAAYVNQYARELNTSMKLLFAAEAGDKKALAKLRKRLAKK